MPGVQGPDALEHALLAALADGEWHSGADLAQALGRSRAALAKRIAGLNEANIGLRIASRHGLGYRIAGGLDLLEDAHGQPQAALRGLPGLRLLRVCDSSSTRLQAEPEARVCLAEYQTAGRGRRGRRWQAGYAQNLLLSLRHRYPSWPTDLPALSPLIGLAVARSLAADGIPARVKWPNDIWLEGRKLGGVLVETRGEAQSGCELIVGLGLNVHMQSATVDQPWHSLALAGLARPRAALASRLIAALEQALEDFPRRPLAGQLAAYAPFDALQGQDLAIEDAGARIEGAYRGLSARAGLRLQTATGEREFVVGEVSVRPGPGASGGS